MLYYCVPPRSRNCRLVPVRLPHWRDLIPPPVGAIARIFWWIRIVILDRFGPRPHPWTPAGNLSESVINDLRVLSGIDSFAAGLSPALRPTLDRALQESIEKLNLGSVASVTSSVGDVPNRAATAAPAT